MIAQAAQAQPASDTRVPTAPPTLRDAYVLITGSTDGLGRELARTLAAEGAHVIVHGRNRARGDSLVAQITATHVGSARFFAADLASLVTVDALADTILAHYPRLDLLINNAGIALNRSLPRQVSTDGYELHFAVNYLAGVLLTERLLPRLAVAPNARIINVASRSQQSLDMSDVMLERGYNGGRGYAQSKLAQIMYTIDLANEQGAAGVAVYAVHPASQMDTKLVRGLGGRPRSTVNEGVETVMYALRSREPSGTYFEGTQVGAPLAQARSANARAQLRAITRALLQPYVRLP